MHRGGAASSLMRCARDENDIWDRLDQTAGFETKAQTMSLPHRFFLLLDPLPVSDIDSLLGRVVASKTSPLDRFAPFPSPGVPPHNTNDIIPSILAAPTVSAPFVNVVAHSTHRAMTPHLSALLKVELHSHEQHELALECDELRRYMLPNPRVCFRDLMANEHYANDVRSLLEESWPRHAYLITGFLVAVNARWTMDSVSGPGAKVEATVPVAEPALMPGGPAASLDVGFDLLSGTKQHRKATTGEEIIGISYSIAKLSYDVSLTAQFVSRVPKIGRAVRAKPHHRSMGDDHDDIPVYDCGDDDLDLSHEHCFSHRQPTGVWIEPHDAEAASDAHLIV